VAGSDGSGPSPFCYYHIYISSFFISMPFSSGLSSTTTWEGSFRSYFLAMSMGIINVADILLVSQTFDRPFAGPFACDITLYLLIQYPNKGSGRGLCLSLS
jgi:hypothetical protein